MEDQKMNETSKKIIEIANKHGLTSDDLYIEAELREEYGEFQYFTLMDYSAEELKEAAAILANQ